MRGVFTALVTPFDSKNQIDLEAYKKLLRDQKEAGVAGVVPCGTTGESPTLSLDEKKLLIQTALGEMKGSKTLVFAGTGSNDTAKTVEFSKWASAAGVQGILVVTPYYNKPTQAGILAHFTAVADAIQCDLMIYNIPGRTGVAITPETIARLSKHPRIRYLKESSGSLSVLSEIQEAVRLGKGDLTIFCGDDGLFLPMLAVGASGVVSVASNVMPRTLIQLQKLHESGKVEQAAQLHQRLYPVFRDLFIESNPAPVKQALEWMGKMQIHVRLPLVSMSSENRNKLRETLDQAGVTQGELP